MFNSFDFKQKLSLSAMSIIPPIFLRFDTDNFEKGVYPGTLWPGLTLILSCTPKHHRDHA